MKALMKYTVLVVVFLPLMAGCATTLNDINKGQMEGLERVPELIEVAQDVKTDVKLRLDAVKALGNIADSRAVQSLLGIALADENRDMREAANKALIAMGKPAVVGGEVKGIDNLSQTVTITTPMGNREVLQLSPSTVAKKQDKKVSLKDLNTGQDVKIDYVRLPGGTVLIKEILIGYYVPRCSCGSGCPCPISRGCKVVRY